MKTMTNVEKALTVGLVAVTGLCAGLGVKTIKYLKQDEAFLNNLKEKTSKIKFMTKKAEENAE